MNGNYVLLRDFGLCVDASAVALVGFLYAIRSAGVNLHIEILLELPDGRTRPKKVRPNMVACTLEQGKLELISCPGSEQELDPKH